MTRGYAGGVDMGQGTDHEGLLTPSSLITKCPSFLPGRKNILPTAFSCQSLLFLLLLLNNTKNSIPVLCMYTSSPFILQPLKIMTDKQLSNGLSRIFSFLFLQSSSDLSSVAPLTHTSWHSSQSILLSECSLP